ncbi:MAG: UDP-glucose--hexose-1-phosphate uridylyltransferase [Lachnospiraceae bacterium]|nr:UDP-glucose--hexose-1-phosphate uridylyltransferase [Lachnospiraceae bacterium]
MMTVEQAVHALIRYGIKTGLICAEEAVYTANYVWDVLGIEPGPEFHAPDEGGCGCEETGKGPGEELESILKVLLDDAAARGAIDGGIASRDLLDTKIMGCLTPRPGEVIRTFRALLKEDPEKATDYFYALSCDSDYIRRYRIVKDRKWIAPTKYGDLDITINLSKPEKDPKAIAAALSRRQESYPKCLLCCENEGYAGRLDHPARQNLRLIPITLDGSDWFMQYSPYVYYNEHCIVLSKEHVPMKIERATFARLLDFLKILPHYTVGSNADLPIVGGSILTHEHFQGGRYTFAMARAELRDSLKFEGFPHVKAGVVNWPMSVIRLDSEDPESLVELADRILTAWRGYSDEEAGVYAYSDSEGRLCAADTEGAVPHNTITPIARMRGGCFELDLVLRNNRTTAEYPLGIFHPHEELHHIKKENIGLIEVMGLAVLPARLLGEMETLKNVLVKGGDVRADSSIASHADWADAIREKYADINAENVSSIIETEIGIAFSEVLEHCGVFRDTEAGRAQMRRFAESVR